LWLGKSLKAVFANANLNCIDSILLLGLHLSDLAPIDLEHGAWHDLAPLVPKVSCANLVPKETSPFAESVRRGCLL
jgi:hypothetical protein